MLAIALPSPDEEINPITVNLDGNSRRYFGFRLRNLDKRSGPRQRIDRDRRAPFQTKSRLSSRGPIRVKRSHCCFCHALTADPFSTAALMSIRSCIKARFATPLKRNIGSDIRRAMKP